MKRKILVVLGVFVILVGGWWLTTPATAITDGPMRQFLENAHFSEFLIKSSLHPKTSHDVYAKDKRQFIHGLPRTNLPYIYEPDVLTWELAMAQHRKQVFDVPPTMDAPLPDFLAPAPMLPAGMLPGAPGQVQLTPLGDQSYYSRPLPPNADQTMDRLMQRARLQGMSAQSPLQAEAIRQQLQSHMNSLNTPAPAAPAFGMPPMAPVRPANMPRGKGGDSFDRTY